MRAKPRSEFRDGQQVLVRLDRLAAEVKFDDYVTMTTIVNAVSIGGERGSEMRDNESLKPQDRALSRIAGPGRQGLFHRTEVALAGHHAAARADRVQRGCSFPSRPVRRRGPCRRPLRSK